MSLFSKILDKLGLRKDKEDEQPATRGTAGASASTPSKPATSAPDLKTTTAGKARGQAPTSEKGVGTSTSTADRRQRDDVAVKHTAAPAPAASTAPRAMSKVDVTNMLEQKAKGTGLNWKQSISDLLFLLDIDNSYDARVELAKELNAPQEVMGDSARMNTWLHKEVLRKIAENGGNIPQDLLD
ncbi:MAG TPA: DUF3597 domain-containing protein [Anaerolineales bacterium]|nr:DUF3597 domain-containing protein [Anaerolineales bacterium]